VPGGYLRGQEAAAHRQVSWNEIVEFRPRSAVRGHPTASASGISAEMAELRPERNHLEQGVRQHARSVRDDWRRERHVARPAELTTLKRIIVKDSAVDSICHGLKVLRFSADIEIGDSVFILTKN
jgi:hypothetical protein